MNATRRSLRETLTRAQRAFLTVAEEPAHPPTEAIAEPSEFPFDSQRSRSPAAPIRPRVAKSIRPVGAVRRREPLRSVTLRLRASVADALRRESIQRSLSYVEPFSQQAIVEAALCAWLERQGCQFGG